MRYWRCINPVQSICKFHRQSVMRYDEGYSLMSIDDWKTIKGIVWNCIWYRIKIIFNFNEWKREETKSLGRIYEPKFLIKKQNGNLFFFFKLKLLWCTYCFSNKSDFRWFMYKSIVFDIQLYFIVPNKAKSTWNWN